MLYLLGFLICLFFLTFSLVMKHKISKKKRHKKEELILSSIQKEIESAKQEREFVSFDRGVGLTNGEISVLNIYDESNIKIPVDILEELTHNRNHLTTEKMIFDYIENQRHFWKLENMKKPYRKVK